MTNKEIRDKGVTGGLMSMHGSYFIEQEFGGDFTANDTEEACEMALDFLMNEARKDTLKTMRDLALWKGGNTAEEKIQHFFKVVNEAIELLNVRD